MITKDQLTQTGIRFITQADAPGRVFAYAPSNNAIGMGGPNKLHEITNPGSIDPSLIENGASVSQQLGLSKLANPQNNDGIYNNFIGVAGGANMSYNDFQNNVFGQYLSNAQATNTQKAAEAAQIASAKNPGFQTVTPQQQAQAAQNTLSTQQGTNLLAVPTPAQQTLLNQVLASPQQKPVAPSTPTISTSALGSQTPLTFQSPTPSTTADAAVAGATAASNQITADKTAYDAQVTAETKSRNDLSGQLSSLLDTSAGQGAATLKAEQDAGLQQKQEAINTVNSQIQTKLAEYAAIQSKYGELSQEQQNKPIPMSLIMGKQAEIDKSLALQKNTFASEIGLLQATAQGLQGQYDLAKTTADRAVDLKYEDINTQITVKQAQLKLVTDLLTADEKKQADALAVQYKAAQDKLAVETANLKDQNATLLNQMQTYPDAGILMTDTLAQANQKITTKSKIYADKVKSGVVGNTTTSPSSVGGTATTTGSIQNDVQAILEGRNTMYNIRQTMGRTNAAAAYMQKIRDQITAIDPNFDFVASDAGGKSVSTSYVQRATASINAVLPNIDIITQLSDQVARIGVKGVDTLLQKGAIQIGDVKVSNFHQAQKLIADEIGVALGAGTVSDMKLQLGFDVTDPNVTQEVFASNMKLVKEFLNNRLDGLNSLRYSSSIVRKDTPIVDQQAINDSLSSIGVKRGSDGFVSPQDWEKIKAEWTKNGGDLSNINSVFGILKNPNNPNYK